MAKDRIARIETLVSALAAATMALALGYAVSSLLDGTYDMPIAPAMAVAAIAFTGIHAALGRVDRIATPAAPPGLSAFPALTLSDFAQVGAPVGVEIGTRYGGCEAAQEPLLLDDILAELGPRSRVVQMFDTQASPGELAGHIDRHLQSRPVGAVPEDSVPDDSVAMFDALDQLRQSLR